MANCSGPYTDMQILKLAKTNIVLNRDSGTNYTDSYQGLYKILEGGTKSLRLTDSYQGIRCLEGKTRSLALTDAYQGLYKDSGGRNKESHTHGLIRRAV